ncbi:helix-turn-helix domain-containing protein [Shimia sp.]|uniref:helix-turn-helix domain-containing protein n=1 Tax=Shimia sp. TaxID=1954381 RepID=UPI003BACB57F
MFAISDYTDAMKLRVKDVRLARGMTVQDLADVTHISKSHISELENNKKTVNGNKLLQLAEGLNCSIIDLIDLPELSPEIRRLLTLANGLSEDAQKELADFAEFRAHSSEQQ